ncbi:MAG: superoxide dismutase family protein [Rhizobacter sp.]|nr:superoxide dismutase family protein [Rhizobacter sp.]
MHRHAPVVRHRFAALALACLGAATLGGCATAARPPVAIAALKPASGSQVNGEVRLTQEGDHVVVHAHVEGLAPNSEHGFHVHEKGDCSAPDASSAGGHFNPTAKPHGASTGEHHMGDLPSLKADAAGVAETSFEVKGSLLGSGATDLMGKALVVHADPDDYMSQPAGNSGARVACGVIASPAKPGGVSGNGETKTIPKQM